MKTSASNWQSVTKRQRQQYKDKVKAVIDEAKLRGCYFCPENDPVVLQFHHIDPKSKKFNVGHSHTNRGISAVQEEIDKCIVVCANDHLRLHSGQISLEDRYVG